MKIKAILTAILAFSVFGLTGCTTNNSSAGSANEPVSASEVKSSLSIGFTDDVSVSSINADGKTIEVTPEVNEKICSLMKEVQLTPHELDLAIMCYIEVTFSNGSILTVDKNPNDHASYYSKKKSESGIVDVPHELKEYLLNMADEADQ